MRATRRNVRNETIVFLLIAAGTATSTGPELHAQEPNPAHTHIEHVRSGFPATPDGSGLLTAALADAEVAARHARLAADDPTYLEGMRLHARHVLHAVDPSRIEEGPGSGFGVKRAAEEVARHIELAAAAEGASDPVVVHAEHVAAAARAVAARADEVAEAVTEIEEAYDYTEAGSAVGRLEELVGQLVEGADLTGDGSVGWGEGEGGLQHVEQHVGLLAAGAGLD